MSVKPLIPRVQADRDVEEIIDYYMIEAGESVAQGFIDSLDNAYNAIARNPAAGSPRLAQILGLRDLRVWPLRRFPHFIFYFDRDSHIDVWRVLHGQRDVPVALQEPEEP